ncbi:SCY1-like protein 2 [Choanephora cucurbitarum]|uniref:SCY1-like protein 2 n=1 Tax=Choanephora cucurbitarum TaxID=101091 RepID=A0A1C7N2J6_9FUNG|nr:SCY1-like protein 2 [Choanephora cucurbitarum]
MSSAFYSFINSITSSLTSRYDIKNQISTAGLWKIYQGERKTTGQKVAIFVFEKKTLDISLKRDRRQENEQIYELLKKEASHLARLRHPSILEVVEPVNESRSSIVFVTEPLMGSLTHLVKSNDTYSSESTPPSLDLDELEIQKGLLQVGKGLQFLSDVKVVHHNLTTDAIFVNAKGDWKIGGLGHGVFLNAGASTEFNSNLPELCQINLDYAGCLAYAVHNKGVSLFKTFNSIHTYEKQLKQLNSNSFQVLPHDLQKVIRMLLRTNPDERMKPLDFQNSSYFDNLLVSTMKFLESFPEKTREEKAQFMKGLARVLGQFPERVLKRKILYSLLEELKDHQLLPFTIPNIFLITQKLTQQEFCDMVLPSLKPVFQVRDPPQHMIVLLEKLDVLQQKTPREIFRDDVMPLVYAALESPTSVVQERALRIIPSLAESLDYTAVKSSLFPRVQTLFVQTTILSVKVSTLICFHSMIKVLDKFTIQEKLVPVLRNIKTKEPAVMLATLAVYDEVGKVADKEIIATEILPQLWRMSFGPLLNLEQFQRFMRTIRDLTDRVEEAHVKHLKEVKSLEEQTHSVSGSASSPHPQASPNLGNTEVSFESLVKGTSTASDSWLSSEQTPTWSPPSQKIQSIPALSNTASTTNTMIPSLSNNSMNSSSNTMTPSLSNMLTSSSSQNNMMNSLQNNTMNSLQNNMMSSLQNNMMNSSQNSMMNSLQNNMVNSSQNSMMASSFSSMLPSSISSSNTMMNTASNMLTPQTHTNFNSSPNLNNRMTSHNQPSPSITSLSSEASHYTLVILQTYARIPNVFFILDSSGILT